MDFLGVKIPSIVWLRNSATLLCEPLTCQRQPQEGPEFIELFGSSDVNGSEKIGVFLGVSKRLAFDQAVFPFWWFCIFFNRFD